MEINDFSFSLNEVKNFVFQCFLLTLQLKEEVVRLSDERFNLLFLVLHVVLAVASWWCLPVLLILLSTFIFVYIKRRFWIIRLVWLFNLERWLVRGCFQSHCLQWFSQYQCFLSVSTVVKRFRNDKYFGFRILRLIANVFVATNNVEFIVDIIVCQNQFVFRRNIRFNLISSIFIWIEIFLVQFLFLLLEWLQFIHFFLHLLNLSVLRKQRVRLVFI